MKTFYLLVRVAPVQGNRIFGILPGAHANIFVCTDSKENAWIEAQRYLKHNYWIPTLDEEIIEISERHQFPSEQSKYLYQESQVFGIAAAFVGFASY